jgi:hypothetical protein
MATPQQVIDNANEHIKEVNSLRLYNVDYNSKKELKKHTHALRNYAYGTLLRDVDLLHRVYFNEDLPQHFKDDAADLLEDLLGKTKNTGIIVETREMIAEHEKQISLLGSPSAAAGGNPQKRRKRTFRRKSIKKRSIKRHH